MSKKYTLLKKEGKARRGRFETPHGTIETPVFMNVGTLAAIKGAVSSMDLKEIGCQVELSNTYHLHLRPSDKVVAEMGGFGILFGFIIGIFSGICMHDILTFPLCIVLIVILLVGIIGIADDLLVLSSKEKLFLLFLAGIPLIWAAPPNVGIVYLICIPIAISIGSNLTNMLAGLNGIESGLGIIALTSLTISCIILGKYDVTIISMSMLGALIAFLYFNKYPAKIFPGDTGTLIIGATIVSIAFIGRVKLIALIVLLPNIIDAALKFYSAGVMERQQFKPTQLDENGNLV